MQQLSCQLLVLTLLLLALAWQLHAAASCPSPKCNCTNRRLVCQQLSQSDWLAMANQSGQASADWLAVSITNSSLGRAIRLEQVAAVAGSSAAEIRLIGNGAKHVLAGKASLQKVQIFDISNNLLEHLPLCDLASAMPQLQELLAADNRLQQINASSGCSSQLAELNISANAIVRLDNGLWRAVPRLIRLDASNNLIRSVTAGVAMQLLRSLLLGKNAFTQLNSNWLEQMKNLETIDFSSSDQLISIGQNFTASLLQLTQLRQILFDNCHQLASWSWGPAMRRLVPRVKGTAAWRCDCELAWLRQRLPLHSLATCAWPPALAGVRIVDVDFQRRVNCSRPVISRFADRANFGVGDIARLLCSVQANPPALITWTTNRRVNISMLPARLVLHASLADTQTNIFHAQHRWHWEQHYQRELAGNAGPPRLQVLQDGSLYIDYVTRADAGVYYCSADNGIGNAVRSEQLIFTLKYEVLREVKKYGIIVGGICAGCLLGIGLTIGLIRLIVRKCSEEERKKKKSIKAMLEHLESYSGAKKEQFREYKVWFRSCRSSHVENYNCRVNKMKDACTTNMLHMQDNYNRRIAKIRDQCDSQMDRLRDSYNQQMSKIKDYKSSQVDRVREQYNQQLLRIKDYAGSQLDRLRDQYKQQQAYFLKVMESLSIDNCMTGIPEDKLIDFGLDLTPDNSDSEEPALLLLTPELPELPLASGDSVAGDDIDDFITATDRGGSRPQLDDFSDDDEEENGIGNRGRVSGHSCSVASGDGSAGDESLRSSQRSRVLQVEVLPALCSRSISSSLPQLLLHYDTSVAIDSDGVVMLPGSLQQQQQQQ